MDNQILLSGNSFHYASMQAIAVFSGVMFLGCPSVCTHKCPTPWGNFFSDLPQQCSLELKCYEADKGFEASIGYIVLSLFPSKFNDIEKSDRAASVGTLKAFLDYQNKPSLEVKKPLCDLPIQFYFARLCNMMIFSNLDDTASQNDFLTWLLIAEDPLTGNKPTNLKKETLSFYSGTARLSDLFGVSTNQHWWSDGYLLSFFFVSAVWQLIVMYWIFNCANKMSKKQCMCFKWRKPLHKAQLLLQCFASWHGTCMLLLDSHYY